jgi:hypothetical protein
MYGVSLIDLRMVAQQGTQPNSSTPRRLLRGISCSQAPPSPTYHRSDTGRTICSWHFRALLSVTTFPRFHLRAPSPRQALSQPRVWRTDVIADTRSPSGLPCLSLNDAMRVGARIGGRLWDAERSAPGVYSWSHGGSPRPFGGCRASECSGQRVAKHGTSLANAAGLKRPIIEEERIVCHGWSTAIHAALKWSVMNSQSVRRAASIFVPIV